MWTSGKFKRYSIDYISDPVHGGMAKWLHANKSLIKDVVGGEILVNTEAGVNANIPCVRFQGSCTSLPLKSQVSRPVTEKEKGKHTLWSMRRLYQSIDSVSPVSCQSADGIEDFSSALLQVDKSRDSVLLKCNAVIGDLEFELEEERSRRRIVEEQLADAREEVRCVFAEMETVATQSQEYISEITRLKIDRLEVEKNLQSRVYALESKLKRTTLPMQNFDEKFAAKFSPSITPPLPNDTSNDLLVRLRDQLVASSAALKGKDEAFRLVVSSYEHQVNQLKKELESNQEVMQGWLKKPHIRRTAVYTPSISPAVPSSTQAEWEQFKKGFSKVQYN